MGARAILRLFVGLVIGFAGAFATLQAIERFGSESEVGEPVAIILGEPDIDGFCERDTDRRMRAFATSTGPFGWQCVGLIGRLWTSEDVDIGDVCRWEYGDVAYERLVDAQSSDGWRCVRNP